MGKWKTQSRFPTFPPPRLLLQSPTQAAGGLSPTPARRRSAPLNQRRLPIRLHPIEATRPGKVVDAGHSSEFHSATGHPRVTGLDAAPQAATRRWDQRAESDAEGA